MLSFSRPGSPKIKTAFLQHATACHVCITFLQHKMLLSVKQAMYRHSNGGETLLSLTACLNNCVGPSHAGWLQAAMTYVILIHAALGRNCSSTTQHACKRVLGSQYVYQSPFQRILMQDAHGLKSWAVPLQHSDVRVVMLSQVKALGLSNACHQCCISAAS